MVKKKTKPLKAANPDKVMKTVGMKNYGKKKIEMLKKAGKKNDVQY